jgi:hypothetical protein
METRALSASDPPIAGRLGRTSLPRARLTLPLTGTVAAE